MNDKYLIPLFVAGSLLLALFTFFLIAYLVISKRKQNKYQLEKQQMVFDHENNILRAKINEQEITMTKLSRELHDDTKSILSHAQMYLQGIAELTTNQKQIALIGETNQIIERVIEDIRTISHSLNGKFIQNIGLVDAVARDLEQINLSKKITYNIEIKGDKFLFSPEKELYIYRIAQEAIGNCVKHAKATHINFMISYENFIFTMKITDNGVGFDKKKMYEMKGIGFLNMMQRAKHINGSLDVQSAPHEGSNVTLTINMK